VKTHQVQELTQHILLVINMIDFIEIYPFTQDEKICDTLVNFFKQNKDRQQQGCVGGKVGAEVDTETKDTTDITMSISKIKNNEEESAVFFPAFNLLQKGLNNYIDKYNILSNINITLSDKFNIQHYKKGQHFKKFHYESSTLYKRKRILVWMFYLNTVEKSGSTNFPYLELQIQPSKSHLLIWPADFTHAHFGDITEEEKYIMTGWFDVVQNEPTTYSSDRFRYFND